jgi:hypothetical protein
MLLETTRRKLTASSVVDLFLDESGSFAPLRGIEEFASQVAGFLAPAGSFAESDAEGVLERAFRTTGTKLPDVVHGTELFRGLPAKERRANYCKVIEELVRELRDKGLQPVRAVNEEDIRYFHRLDSQVNITAELVIRIADRVSTERTGLQINVHPARTSLGPGRGSITRKAYAEAMHVQTSFALARRGLPLEQWNVTVGEIVAAERSRRLQIADLISHASHADFSPLRPEAAKLLKEFLEGFDFTLAIPFVLDFVNDCLAVGSIGSAIQALGERVVLRQLSSQLRAGTKAANARIVDALTKLPTGARDSHLGQLLNWIEQLVQQRGDLDLTIATIQWIMKAIEQPLCERLSTGSLEWFSFGLRAWLLTALNHTGRFGEGHDVAVRMEALVGKLAGQWEHSSILMGGLITVAVHELDRRDFAKARARAEAVAEFYGSLAGLFAHAMPEVFPKIVRSNLRGKALGTALQAYILDSDATLDHFTKARALSDEALAEFTAPDDISRQWQYRSQLEARAKDFSAARIMLARSLGHEKSDHEEIARSIALLPHASMGFPLLHWLRIGAEASLSGFAEEAEAFLSALEGSELQQSPWCRGEVRQFPAHGILHHLAIVHACGQNESASLHAVNRLGELESTRQSPALTLVHCATIAAVTSLLRPRQEIFSRLLFRKDPRGLQKLVEELQAKTPGMELLQAELRQWSQLLGNIASAAVGDAVARDGLLKVARRVVT